MPKLYPCQTFIFLYEEKKSHPGKFFHENDSFVNFINL